MVPKAFIWLVLLLFSASAFAQVPTQQRPPTPPPTTASHEITGKLLFSMPNPPEERIEVHLERSLQRIQTTFTDSLGNFNFRGLQPGSYTVVVRVDGFEDVNQQVEIFSVQRTVTVPVAMNPSIKITRRPRTFEGDDPNVVDVDQILQKFPKKAVQEYEKGVDENRKGETAKAIKRFEEALKLAPDFYHAHNNLGVAYMKLDRFKDAETHYQRARELNKKAEQPLLNLAVLYINQSDAVRAEGRDVYGKLLDDAMDLLDEAIKIKPNSAAAHYYLGSAYYKSDFFVEAEASLKRAVDLNSTSVNARPMLINVYIRQQRWNEVLGQIDAFLKENPKSEERKTMEALRVKISKGLTP